MAAQVDHPNKLPSWIQSLWQRIVLVWTTARDPQHELLSLDERYRLRVNNGILLLFIPLMAINTLLWMFGYGGPQHDQDVLQTLVASGTVFSVVVFLYLFTRGGARWVMGWVSPFIALALTLGYSAVSAPPHIEIIGLALIPMIASFTLQRRGMIAMSLVSTAVMVTFVMTSRDLNSSFLGAYYVWFFFVVLIVSLYLVSQRNWLDEQRSRQVASEQTQHALLVQYLPGLVWQVDQRMRITIFNQQALPSASAVEALHIAQAVILNEKHRSALNRALQEGVSLSIEHEWLGAPYRTFIKPINTSDYSGGAICLTIDVQDMVQEQKRVLHEAIEEERRRVLKDFLDDATHDIRTPLSVIYTNLYLMEIATDPEKVKARRDMLKASISQLEEMLQNMFLMTRLDLLPSFVSSEFNLNAVVEAAIDQVADSAQEKGVEIQKDLNPALPTMMGHSGEMQLAIYHIARNAVQHTQEGVIRVSTRYDNRHITIEIADTGEGIPAEDIPNIFKRFYRGDKARTLVGARNGMGLAIAKKVVEKHNGKIDVTSEVGRGTTMSITLAP